MSVCIAVDFLLTVAAKLIQVQAGEIDPFLPARLQNAGIPGMLLFGKVRDAVKHAGAAVAIRHSFGIVAGGDCQHVFRMPGREAGKDG